VTLRVLTAHGADAATWQAVVDRQLHRDVMLTPAYARVQEVVEQGQAICLTYGDVMLPGMLLRNACGQEMKSFFGGGGPTEFSDDAEQAFTGWLKAHVVCEYAQCRYPCAKPPHAQHCKDAVVIDLLAIKPERNRRRELKNEEAVRVRRMPPIVVLRDFHKLYTQSMVRLHADQSWRWEEATWQVWRNEMRDDRMAIFAADVPGGPVESMLLVIFGDGRAYAMFIGGERYHSTLYLRAMEWCRDVADCHEFYLGGGRTDKSDDSLLMFKKSFGGLVVPVYRYRRIYDQAAYAKLAEHCPPTDFFPPWRAAA
jgi:hypothetical protein